MSEDCPDAASHRHPGIASQKNQSPDRPGRLQPGTLSCGQDLAALQSKTVQHSAIHRRLCHSRSPFLVDELNAADEFLPDFHRGGLDTLYNLPW